MNHLPPSSTPNSENLPEPGLYIVATPIGNLRDMTLRALDVLMAADVIACEDTRVTTKLKNAYGLKAPLISYHNHNEEKATAHLINILKEGDKIVALVSDAGTPLMSDPGYRVTKACIDEGLPVVSIPGACASITALTLSGLPVHRFLFNGFLPAKTHARKEELKTLATIPSTLVFYESAHRILPCLEDIHEVLGDRDAVIAREMTKRFEEVIRGPLSELIAHCQKQDKMKGEITLVVAPPDKNANTASAEDIDRMLLSAVNDDKMSVKDAAGHVAEMTGQKKRALYNRLLQLQNDNDPE